jgi:ornithine cyclodeaminase/alanine dehydrogenase-like protein (mu-crystallin family)
MLVLTESQVRSCLPLSLALQASSHAFYTAAHGTSTTPPRIVLSIPPPASSPAAAATHTLFKPSLTPSALGVKIVSVRPSNSALSLPTVPASHIAGTALTAIRTAAGSGVATQLFASPTVTAMAVFGAGAQAEAHVRVMLLVRPHCRTVHVVNRSAARAQAMIERLQREHAAVSFQATILSGDEPSAAEAELLAGVVFSCQLLCLCTASPRPLLRASMVAAGTHINAVGSYTADCCEMEGELVRRCRVVVDDDGAWSSGDLAQPLQAGLIDRSHVHGSLGDYVSHHFASWPVYAEAHTVHDAAHHSDPAAPQPKTLRNSPTSAHRSSSLSRPLRQTAG